MDCDFDNHQEFETEYELLYELEVNNSGCVVSPNSINIENPSEPLNECKY